MSLDYLCFELHSIGVLGRTDADKVRIYTMFRSEDTLLLRALGHFYWLDTWIIVHRSSRQCYHVSVFRTDKCNKYSSFRTFGNIRLTADFIKNLI